MRLHTNFKKILSVFVFFISFCVQSQQHTKKLDYAITPINIKNVKLTDKFWLPIIKKIQEKTIEYAIHKCEEEGRLDNFLIAGKQKEIE